MTITLNIEAGDVTTDADLENLALSALEADLAAKEAAEKAAALKAALKKALEAKGQLNPDFRGIGPVRTIIKKTQKFDPKKALELLNEAEIAQCSSIDGALVKQNVSPSVYSLMQSEGTTSLELRVSDS